MKKEEMAAYEEAIVKESGQHAYNGGRLCER